MLIHTISLYLESHKRLVVPQLGVFIVKEAGKVVLFSELMKRDDGELRALLAAEGKSELEVAGEIDRFVFEVKNALQHGEEYPLDGFGRMCPGDNGIIHFVFDPTVKVEQPAGEQIPVPVEKPVAESPVSELPVETTAEERKKTKSELQAEPVVEETPAAEEAPVEAEQTPLKKKLAELYEEPAGETPRPHRRPRGAVRKSGKKGSDRFIWLALAAVLIALLAIAYGYVADFQSGVGIFARLFGGE